MKLFRAWYYFRLGYAAYIALVLGGFSSITVIYRLGLEDIPYLSSVFPHLAIFTLFALATGIPICILIGYIHAKRTNALATDISINAEMNPYNHILMPGKEKEVLIPLLVAIAKGLEDPPLAIIEKAEKLLKGESI